jgi:tRNA G10  N-methylase Trm11
MDSLRHLPTSYIYTFACHEDEVDLSRLEMRSFFGCDSEINILRSSIAVDPTRSPFLKERIEIWYEGDRVSDIAEQVPGIQLRESTFKVIFVKTNDLQPSGKIEYEEQRAIEREVGWKIIGKADVRSPDVTFGIVTLGGRWYFGPHLTNESSWMKHRDKPRNYSMALPVRLAKAAVNIAVPRPDGVHAIDPCCGIGTILVEARAMGIAIDGRDLNPLVVIGARENLAHFDLESTVTLGSIAEVEEHYDVAIVDMPYNLVSKISPEEKLLLLSHARRIADKTVVLSIEPIDEMLEAAGFEIADRCIVSKGSFARHLMVCR